MNTNREEALFALALQKRAAKRPALREEATYRLMTIVGGLLMYAPFWDGGRPSLLWLEPIAVDWEMW